jgi:hypothetical protein
MCPNIIFTRLRVILTFEVVTVLLGFILIKIELHRHPFFLGSHAKKGIGYHVRVLSSIALPYTTKETLPETMDDRDNVAYNLVPKALKEILGERDEAWKTERRGPRGTTFIVKK